MIENLNCKKGVAIVLTGLLVNVTAKGQGKGAKGSTGLTRQEGSTRGSLFSGLGLNNLVQRQSIFGILPGLGPRVEPRAGGSGSKGKSCKKKSKSSKKCSKSSKKHSKSSKKCEKSPDCKHHVPPASHPGTGGSGTTTGKKGPKTVINNIIVDSTVQNVNVTNNNNVQITAGGDINGDINILQNGPVTGQSSTKSNTIQNTLVTSRTGTGGAVARTLPTRRY